jgi:LPS export ABC transporter protein LptC
MQKNKFLFIPILISLLLSCSMDYSDAEIAEELGEDIPDNIIESFSYTSVDSGQIVFRLYSKKAENYNKKKETILEEVVFREYNSKDELVTEGTAEKGLIFNDSDDAELTGSLIIYSAENESEISTDYLYWDDSEKTLSGSKDGKVKLLRDSGTEITGTGFTGDLKTKIFNFERDVHGIYHYEED